MIRFFADIIYLFFFLTLTAPLYPLFDHWNRTGQQHRRSAMAQRMIRNAFERCLRFAGTELIVEGREKIPTDTAVLYVGNHSSYYDILCSYCATPSGAGFFAKKEMESIPCLRHWMRFINCLFLDRKNIKEGLKTMNQGTEYLKDGFSMVIFPEGTRSQDEDPHDFKEGSLRPAFKAQVPVIPMAISGTADILENNRKYTVKPTTVHITFGDPIYPKELDRASQKHLGATIREEIIEMRKKHKTIA
jgi:1-acyl-sn-glycerol-3-phosphate acyltransferase